ncbi:type II secretion system protein E (GspE) [Nitratifractor salsuginis DSM 16511]|uniref:Type II secretion system protein E (GspE) n=2 Tax=Nitratifractor salsuginis TaxID=269261 RepID=E6WY70_NITSE|nr:type II secretion system protein E (GspE) [Nitratifractor salsuginis DSM 16511]
MEETMRIPQLKDRDFEPWWSEEIDHKTALKHHLLFALIDEKPVAILHPEHMAEGLNQLARLGLKIPAYQTDKESFDRLKNKFLELQTSNDFEEMETGSEELIEAESELLEFIQNAQDLLSSEASAPVIKLVNSLFFQAIKKGASDIHIESHERKGEVRLRIDGALKKHLDLDRRITQLVINRIKVISSLDISEKRTPQDGRTQVSISGNTLDVRVSVLPTYHGERVVMRILMQSEHIPGLEELGFDPELTEAFNRLLTHSHGMILVTGPTGSGKSTTLHSFLQTINSPDKNLITIEDPVEYNAENINQIQVNEKVGLTFASGLRSILRQDPDVVMVGEIRDRETAQIAVQASLTGHLMLSTLHTNDATSAITRLMDMGIESYLLASTLLGVLAQRLARRLCPHCKAPTRLDPAQALEAGLDPEGRYYRAVGCSQCDYTGYRGRQAVGELFLIDDEVKNMMDKGLNDHEIRERMKATGMRTISDRLREMVIEGSTSYEEALRVGLMDG